MTRCIDDDAFGAILESINAPGLVGHLQVVNDKSSPCCGRGAEIVCAGELDVDGKQIAIHLGLCGDFPASLPVICLLNPGEIGRVPHVEPDGYVCFAQSEGLLLDRWNPTGIIEEAVARTVITIREGITGNNIWDFVDEFEAYWRQSKQCLSCDSFVEPIDVAHEIILVRRRSPHEGYDYAADSEACAEAFDSRLRQFTTVSALYVPLQANSLVLPPEPGSFWSTAELRAVVRQNVSETNMKLLDKFIGKHKYEEVVVLKIPRPKGGEVLVGVQCLGVEAAHPLHPDGSAKQLTPIVLTRKDKTYLLPRGGASVSLSDKRVALIGCGSVGGHVAMELVRSGALNLTLIDPDRLSTDNIFRHVLGKTAIGLYKAVALGDELRRLFPYLRIRAYPVPVGVAMELGMFRPENFDFIIVAVGEPPLSLHLNHIFCDRPKSPPVLYTWVEAYGIGGHALLTLNNSRKGCLECLYTPLSDDQDLQDRSSFAAPGQSFAKDLSGCAGLFTPFSSLDAVRTAALAVEVTINALRGRMEGNPLLSWKGSKDAFVDAGYTMSDRYSLSTEELYEYRFEHPNPRCPVCRGGA